jgi:predicted porin
MSGNGYNRIARATLIQDINGRFIDVVMDKNGAPKPFSDVGVFPGRIVDKDGTVVIDETGELGQGTPEGLRYETVVWHSAGLMTSPDSKTTLGNYDYDNGLAHSGYVNNALQIGGGMNGFSVTFQGVFDETEALDGAGLVEAKYVHGDPKNPDFVVFAAGSYVDFGDFGSSVTNSFKDTTEETLTKGSNWKVGAQYNLKMPDGKMTIGLQYEDAEIGTPDRDINSDGGKYIMGSLEFQKGPVAIGGWVATYLSDVQEELRYKIYDGSFDSINNPDATKAEWVDEDSISFAVGAKYFFSKRTLLFGGYRQTDSDNNYRDEGVFGVGMRHSF